MAALTGQPKVSTWRAGAGLTTQIAFREIVLAVSGDVIDLPDSITLSSGTGAPTHTRQDGSWYFRSNGDTYKRVSGVWSLTSGGNTEVVANKTGGALTKGEVVYISGYDATLDAPSVTEATNTDLDTRAGLVLEEDIADNASGAASGFARITGLDTSGYTGVGTKLYLDTAGAVTQTAPTGSTAIVQEVGEVKVKSATIGEILYYPAYSKVQGIEASDIQALTASAAELNVLDGVTAGTVTASKGVVVDGSKNIEEFGRVRAATFNRDNADLNINTTTGGAVYIDAVENLDIEAAGGAITIGGDAAAEAVNIATGAAARAITIGNAASASLAMDGGVGAVSLQGDTTLAIDAGTALTIESSGGAISVGADAVAQNVNIGTGAAARQINIGNAASAGVLIEGGVGGINIDCDTTFDMLSGGAFSIDGTGASNVTADTGNLTISTTTSGNVVLTSADGEITANDLIRPTAAAGAAAAAALLIGVGTTGDPATTAAADNNFLEFRTQTTATSGDTRGLYMQLDAAGVGVGGDAVRGRALVTAAGTAGTLDGGSFTLEYNGGSVAGQGLGGRLNVVFPNATVTGGTVYGGLSEYYLGGTSFVNNLAASALHCFCVTGANAATRNAQVLNLFEVAGVTSTSGGMYYQSTGAVPGNSDGSLRIMTPDGAKWILLFNQEAA